QTAHLHVFDRLGLYGKIGSLCSWNRNDSRRGNEEKTFHHLHFVPPCCTSVGGFELRRVQRAPWKVPVSPRTTRKPVHTLDSRTGRPGDAPLRRAIRLAHGGTQAM